jgi:hypothetical protein
MENQTINTNPTRMGLRFLLAPEDSSPPSAGAAMPCGLTIWNHAKTLLWFVFSVLAALLVGQL